LSLEWWIGLVDACEQATHGVEDGSTRRGEVVRVVERRRRRRIWQE